jgi:general L-amino acid transport system permease protein
MLWGFAPGCLGCRRCSHGHERAGAQRVQFRGGVSVSPEFTALLLGLVLYTAAFVAEVVRAGIQAVSNGQTEAAMAMGLKPGLILNLVILPQALRVIIPPLTSQMLNLTKNSSLAVAIGYPDFVSVAGTTINQTGQAIEGVALIMACYLFFSLTTSAFMNWYNKKMALVERYPHDELRPIKHTWRKRSGRRSPPSGSSGLG